MPEHNSTAGLLADRKVFAMGAARGLGLAFVKSIAKAGGAVTLADTPGERVQEEVVAPRAAGFDVYGFTLDFGDPASIRTCAVVATQALGGSDGLVNNAAITNSGGRDASSIDIEARDHVMNVNARGTWLMTTACLSALKASGRGAIVNLSSDIPLWGTPDPLAYVTSKSAVTGMMKSLAHECGADGITVNVIAPGLTLVEATEYVPAYRRALHRDQRAISRDQLPDDVCDAVLSVLSDLSRFVTDQTLTVNGGSTMQ